MTPPTGRVDERDCERCGDCLESPGYQGGCGCVDDGSGWIGGHSESEAKSKSKIGAKR